MVIAWIHSSVVGTESLSLRGSTNLWGVWRTGDALYSVKSCRACSSVALEAGSWTWSMEEWAWCGWAMDTNTWRGGVGVGRAYHLVEWRQGPVGWGWAPGVRLGPRGVSCVVEALNLSTAVGSRCPSRPGAWNQVLHTGGMRPASRQLEKLLPGPVSYAYYPINCGTRRSSICPACSVSTAQPCEPWVTRSYRDPSLPGVESGETEQLLLKLLATT